MNTSTSNTLDERGLSFRKTEAILSRRKAVVANGVGIFLPTSVVSAKGGIITDADGNRLLDFGGGIGVLNAGHCPDPVVKAIQLQAEKLIHSCFHVSTYEGYIQLCEKLIALFPHGDATKAMLTNTGAEAETHKAFITVKHTCKIPATQTW